MTTTTKFLLLSVLASKLPASTLAESSSALRMGLFDGIAKAFANEEYSAPPEGIKATARHILVKDASQVDAVMEKLRDGAPFAEVARQMNCSREYCRQVVQRALRKLRKTSIQHGLVEPAH